MDWVKHPAHRVLRGCGDPDRLGLPRISALAKMPVDLTREEKAGLIELLAGLVESSPFPEAERVQALRRILAKLRADMPRPTISEGDSLGAPASGSGKREAVVDLLKQAAG